MKTDAKPETYRIHELRAENFKRLKAVTIKPDGNMVQITGRNGQGKTSTLDAIVAAIAGKASIQKQPIRKGAKEGTIFLDLGSIRVTRRFEIKDGAEWTTDLTVEGKDGRMYRTPQAVMDDLMGDLAFDPLSFMRLDDKGRFDLLKQFVPEVDFERIAKEDARDRQDRTAVGRRQHEYEGAAKAIEVPEDTPDQPVDVEQLLQDHRDATAHNARLKEIDDLLDQAEKLRAQAATMETKAAQMRQSIENFEPIDLDPIQERGRNARAINAAVQRKQEKAENIRVAKMAEDQYNALTAKIANRQKEKEKAIAAAKMPVAGVAFADDNAIMFNGLPFDQASGAEQLRLSTKIAMALNPKLRVILIRDGSLLDADALRALGVMAVESDYQVFIERVASGEKVGVVIEDGQVSS